ncbi:MULTISPECIES: DNA polymerase III subunit chi [Vibrio]|uniref:DNA polymerase III subunit chi n=1 Tax=Vibrio chanodichtyis TaxID=3027932 RepID=A0ABT5V0M0_9VIBR|nr:MULTISPECIES: DNA polymerase III subunit chi [Vibrio]MDE1515104.1 DNA polymerase III subunit chi [Vibrio chanodichtyis]
MPTATFYLISPSSAQATVTGLIEYVLYLARHFTAQGARIYLQCQDKQHAEQLAEHFWQLEAEQFLAHNLVGEGPKSGSAIEIGYVGVTPSWNRQLAINLADNQTTFARTFAEVVDFVPCAENAKQLARERYKLYRQAGYQLQTVEIQYP